MALGPCANRLEGGLQNSASVTSWKKELPKVVATSIYVPCGSPSCLLLLWVAPQDQQVSLTQVSFKLGLPTWLSG